MSLKDEPVDALPIAIGKALAERMKERGLAAEVAVGLDRFGVLHPRSFRVVLTYDEGEGVDAFIPAGTARGAGIARSRVFDKSFAFRMAITGRSERPSASTESHRQAVDVFVDALVCELVTVCHGRGLALGSSLRGGFPRLDSSPTDDTPITDGAVYVLSGQIIRGVLGAEHAIATGLVPAVPHQITVGV